MIQLFLLLQLCRASLTVLDPIELTNSFIREYEGPTINTSQATFGDITHNMLNGTIVYDSTNPTGCSRMNLTQNVPSDATNQTILPTIALLDRGKCSFATKARNAERSGASLVIVADDRYENIQEVTMNDDGMGSSIGIPTVLIDRYSGMLFKEYVSQNATVSVNLDGAAKQQKIDIELWYSSNSEEALALISELRPYAEQLSQQINFIPRVISWSCPTCSRSYRKYECLDNGQYCAPSNSKNNSRSIEGREILMENLRQQCVYQIVDQQGKQHKWFEYVEKFYANCFVDYKFLSPPLSVCSRNATESLDLSWTETMRCVNSSFEESEEEKQLNKNFILEVNQDQWNQYGTLAWPSVTINRQPFSGNLGVEEIMGAICLALNGGPTLCQQQTQGMVSGRFRQMVIDDFGQQLLVLIAFVLLVTNFGLILYYRVYVKKEMELNKVPQAANQTRQVEDANNISDSSRS